MGEQKKLNEEDLSHVTGGMTEEEWKKELAELSKSYARESSDLKPIRDELKELYKLKSKLDTILRQTEAQDKNNETRKENYAQEKETH